MKRAVIQGNYVEGDEAVAERRIQANAKWHRQYDQEEHYGDLLQPFIGNKPNRDFALAYPELVDEYYTDEDKQQLT